MAASAQDSLAVTSASSPSADDSEAEPLTGLDAWIQCVAVIQFDLEAGPVSKPTDIITGRSVHDEADVMCLLCSRWSSVILPTVCLLLR